MEESEVIKVYSNPSKDLDIEEFILMEMSMTKKVFENTYTLRRNYLEYKIFHELYHEDKVLFEDIITSLFYHNIYLNKNYKADFYDLSVKYLRLTRRISDLKEYKPYTTYSTIKILEDLDEIKK